MNRRTIQWYAVLWLLGVAFLWWPFALVRTLADRRPSGRRPVALLIACGSLLVSLLVAVVRGAEPSRLIAASANLCIWLTLCLALARRWERRDAIEVMRGLIDLAVFQGIGVVIGQLIHPALVGTTLPLARALPEFLANEPNIAAFSTLQLSQVGYYGGFVVRTGGIFGVATWAGALAALAILVLAFSGRSLGPQMQRPVFRLGALTLSALTLYWSYGRVDVLALGLAVVAVLVLRARRVLQPCLWLAALLILVGMTIAMAPALPVDRWFGAVNEPRQGSLTTRTDIYKSTLDEVTEAPTPLLGVGIKQRTEGLVASQGTHSSYLGLAYRGGLLCSLSLLAFLLGLGYQAIHRDADVAFGLVCFLVVWCVTDDIDAGNLAPLAIMIAYGLALGPPDADAVVGDDDADRDVVPAGVAT